MKGGKHTCPGCGHELNGEQELEVTAFAKVTSEATLKDLLNGDNNWTDVKNPQYRTVNCPECGDKVKLDQLPKKALKEA